MNNDKSTTETITAKCVICHRNFATFKEKPEPTCGDPSCIREARERGIPFHYQLPLVPLTPKRDRKRTPGQPRRKQI
ncbi:hypothetical protein LCGC14_0921750 [marine sediment metagenome]|uniref:Uncharacterized protein n=1 Tax=marine sediment metagenome TaxID=412755 RepID=A0A0F9NQM8_9ZZZZ